MPKQMIVFNRVPLQNWHDHGEFVFFSPYVVFPGPYRWISPFSLKPKMLSLIFLYVWGSDTQIRHPQWHIGHVRKNLKDRNLEADPKTKINKTCCTLKHQKPGRTCSPTKDPKNKETTWFAENEQGHWASVTEIITSRVFWSNKKVTKISLPKVASQKTQPFQFFVLHDILPFQKILCGSDAAGLAPMASVYTETTSVVFWWYQPRGDGLEV